MSFASLSTPGAKGLGISVRSVEESKSLPRLPAESSTTASKSSKPPGISPELSKSQEVLDDICRFQSDTWAFEILSLTISIFALLIAAAALKYFDGKQYPSWPHSLTLNAFISVCMTIMVASLTVPVSGGLGQLKWIRSRQAGVSVMELDTLDRASRGMWGSVCALFTLTGGVLGALGSIITIIAFAAAPFGQQSIFSSEGAVETVQDPSAVAIMCTATNSLADICPVNSLSGDFQKDRNEEAAFMRRGYYSSIYSTFNKSILSDNLATCPTNNCTWAPFATLSLCSACTNITSFLATNPTTGNLPGKSGQNASIPNGPSLDSSFDTFIIGVTEPSTRIPSNNATIHTFAALQASESGLVEAIECSLSLCVQLVETSLSGNVYTETILQQSTESRTQREVPAANATFVKNYDSELKFTIPDFARGTAFTNEIVVDLFQFKCLSGLLEFDTREYLPLAQMGLAKMMKVVENMSIAVGRGLRSVCVDSTKVLGSSWEDVVLVRINWWWFTLPVVVEALAIGFFIWLSIYNRMARIQLWKSSLVAVLYHGLDLQQLRRGDCPEGLYDMEQVAEKMKVSLAVTGSNEKSSSRLMRC